MKIQSQRMGNGEVKGIIVDVIEDVKVIGCFEIIVEEVSIGTRQSGIPVIGFETVK